MPRMIALVVFMLLVVATAALSGQFVGGDWYHQRMNQPVWNPPPVVLTSVWAVLYVLMGVSAWMVWEARRGLARVALGLWGLQLILGVGWSWMYFGLHRIGWALPVLGLWLLVVVAVIVTFRAIKREASSLMMPLSAWLLFTLVLNFVQWQLNGGGTTSIFG